jgi:carbonic anhydrase/acetyltransferase-like protein (isoleucine patch superfamily)
MKRNKSGRRPSLSLPGAIEMLDPRLLPSGSSAVASLLENPIGYRAVAPNRPVMPFSTPPKKATYIDPTVSIENGNSVIIGYQCFIGPYANLNGGGGAIKIGNSSSVLDNAIVRANAGFAGKKPEILIGNEVVIGFNAKVFGPSVIGAFGSPNEPTSIGPGAFIDGATIEPGAIVSPRARVGPGVTVPSGFMVLPGVNVTSNEEASNPKLGMVVKVTSSEIATIKSTISDNVALANGYASLYEGNSATGASQGVSTAISGVYSGNLSTILGANLQPGPTTASFEPAKSGPQFLTPNQGLVGVVLPNFSSRLTGGVMISMRAWQAALRMGRANAYRGDQGQPIAIGSIARTGSHVSINSPVSGTLTIGEDLRTGSNVVIVSGNKVNAKIGDQVTIDSDAVVMQTSIGSDSTVGKGAVLENSTFPAHTVIPANAIYVNNNFAGYVQW